MSDNINFHDSYFRSVIRHPIVYKQFLTWLAPQDIISNIDLDAVKFLNTTYIDKKLRSTFSDVVFDCQFKDSKNQSSHEGRIIILIEHQSTPQQFLPVRVHHYMMSVLNTLLKERKSNRNKSPLPAIYPMIYYNGKYKDYPYSTKLRDCVNGPTQATKHFSNEDIQVVNVNTLSIPQTSNHLLAGVMTQAMKRSTKNKTIRNYQAVLSQLSSIQINRDIPAGFTESTIRYMMSVNPIDSLNELIEQTSKLSENVRGEAMTIAEAFELRGEKRGEERGEKRGEERGLLKKAKKVAINMLKKGMKITDIAELTELDVEYIQKLSREQITKLDA